MAKCRSCGAEIAWVKTSSGANMPVDPDYIHYHEAKEGDKLVTDCGQVLHVWPDAAFRNLKGRISHFSTCPNADEHRKSK